MAIFGLFIGHITKEPSLCDTFFSENLEISVIVFIFAVEKIKVVRI